MPTLPSLTNNVAYLGLVFSLIVIPRILQRFRLPAPITSFGLGILATAVMGTGIRDTTLSVLATLGISSLFLFAGLEVDLKALRKGLWPLLSHLAVRSCTIAAATYLGMRYGGFSWNVSALLALAVLTPSTGFILESLPGLGLDDEERFWVTIKAIGGEILALAALFVILQADSVPHLLVSTGAIVGMIVGIPVFLTLLVRFVIPYAPSSEFSLLVMVGLIAAYLTEHLGVHYLVGAFLAGLIARILRPRMPRLASDDNLHAIQLFATFFIPFYFFSQGMGVPSGALSWDALRMGIGLTGAVLPFRIASVWLQRRFISGESARVSLRVATALTPTLIFTMVLATILKERFGLADAVYGALLVYAVLSTLLPSAILSKPADFSPQVPPPRPNATQPDSVAVRSAQG